MYVDNIVVSGGDERGIPETKAWLKSKLHIKDLGQLHYVLGLEVLRDKQGIYLCQKKYVHDLLKDSGILHIKPVETPLEFGVKLQTNEGDALEDVSRYRRLVRKLIHLTVTHPHFLCSKFGK